MSFNTRIDYYGQSASTVLELIGSSENASFPVNATANNERGDVIARDTSAVNREAATCDFKVKAAGDLTLSLGAVTTVSSIVHCLTGLSINTKAGTPPTVSLNGESLQAAATVSSTIAVGTIALKALHKAQILMGAFTLTGTGCYLDECSLECKAMLTRATKDGATLAHDVHGASIVVTGKVIQSGATAPTIAAESGWKITAPATHGEPDEQNFVEWSFAVTKDLTSAEPA